MTNDEKMRRRARYGQAPMMVKIPPFPSMVALATLTFVACATPSRPLSTRVVEDPIVLPRRTAAASVFVDRTLTSARTSPAWGAGLRLGLTDRLQWTDFLSLTYAFLDDAPGAPEPGRPFSLALRAGALGIGGSSGEGFIVLPLASIAASKHLGDRWRLGTSLQWFARWSSTPVSRQRPFDDALDWTGSRWAQLGWTAYATRQLGDHVALGISGVLAQLHACADVRCGAVRRSTSATLSLHVRPWRWLTVSPYVSAGTRHRLVPVIVDQLNPIEPALVPRMSVRWLGAGVNATFIW